MKTRHPNRWILIHLTHPLPLGRGSMKKTRALWVYVQEAFARMNASAKVSLSLTSTFSRGKNACDLVLIRVVASPKTFDRFMREESVWLRAFGNVAVATFPPMKRGLAVGHG